MKILILGGDGMLGHQLLRRFEDAHEVRVTLRRPVAAYRRFSMFTPSNSMGEVDALDHEAVRRVVEAFRPDSIINCVGIVKQRREAHVAIPSIEINALLPHRLLDLCQQAEARLIHISTDCVFSGRTGGYTQDDIPDPVDLYGRSKLLGEVGDSPALTVRSSIIGLELKGFTGLVEWFLAQRGIIRGFRRAIYTGFTTREFARIIERILTRHPQLTGVWQVASQPINKFDLLRMLAQQLDRQDVRIEPDDEFVCDRSLRGDAFTAKTGYVAPGWAEMLAELGDEIRRRGSRPAPID